MDCKECQGKCCKHVAIEIDKPEEKSDFENIKWYAAHKNTRVWVNDEDEWHVEFLTPCEHLDEDYKCKIYERRPEICRDYGVDELCVTSEKESEEEFAFENIEDVEKYLEENY